MDLPRTIVGLVMVADWDENEDPSQVFIRTKEGTEYLVEGHLADELLGHVRSRVKATGRTWENDFERYIDVDTYLVLDD